ncbi:MAG: hypothetical protein KOO63_16555 [Bacteroidales bacterium]|nr:hypothetical protein [Candidatus Latescibacterota bacterium]
MRIKSVALALLVILAVAMSVSAQKKTVLKIEGENLFMFQEFILVLAEEDGKVTVSVAPPEGTLPKEYENIDIQGGDIVKMMNGKRVKTTAAIKKIYEKLEIGDEIKLGVKREDEMFIVTFKKADPEDMKGKMMIRKEVIEDEEDIEED